jgi:lipoprotein-releasing system permease protein
VSFELFVAFRYLKAKRKGLFAAVTTAIGVLGVTLGVAALITTLSVMNGFQTDIQKKIVGAQAHLTVYGARSQQSLDYVARQLKDQPEIVATAPFVLGQAIVTHDERTIGVVLKGLDPAREFAVNELGKSLVEGDWKGLDDGKKPGIVLGQELADNLGAAVGSEVTLVSPKSVASPLGLLPKMQRFTVCGVLHTGYYEYDATTAYAALPAAAKFFGIEAGATGVAARVQKLSQAEPVAKRLQESFGMTHLVRSYSQMNRTLFAALKLEKAVMFIILTLIVLVASLNIASTLILLGVEKTRDIGLLKAMGASPAQIKRVFFLLGLSIGGIGVVMGTGLGLFLCWIVERYPIVELPSDIYYLSRVPVDLQWGDVLAVTVSGLLLSLIATLYPSGRAAKVNPVEAIHYG